MATQHPDSTVVFDVKKEIEEAIEDVTPLERGGRGCDEKMVDYEGKATPYNQMRFIIEEAYNRGLDPGNLFLITPRVPNPSLEEKDRHLLAITAAVTANMYSQLLNKTNTIKYIVLPMTTSSYETAMVQRRILKVERLVAEEFGLREEEWIRLIPLFEDPVSHTHVDEIMESVRVSLIREVGLFERSFRPFIGKSDAAIKGGHIASSISVKLAILKLWKWSREEMLDIYPIIGMGKPPFRGHLAEWNRDLWVETWRGYYTVTIQSALRFNTPREEYVYTIEKLKENCCIKPDLSLLENEKTYKLMASEAASAYKEDLELVEELIAFMARFVINTRARLDTYTRRSHTGRELPRAIKFCAALYSMGLGPSLLGASIIEEFARKDKLDDLLKLLPSLKRDFEYDASFTFPEVFKRYLGDKAEKILKGLKVVKEYLGVDESFRPSEEYEKKLHELRDSLANEVNAKTLIIELGEMRGFLG